MSNKTSSQCLTRSAEPFHQSCSSDNQSQACKIGGNSNAAYIDKLYYIHIKYGIKCLWYKKIVFISIKQKVKAIQISLWSLLSFVERGKLSHQFYSKKDIYSFYLL